jgi:hypothetical protein
MNQLIKEIDVGLTSCGILTFPMLGLGVLLSQTQGSFDRKVVICLLVDYFKCWWLPGSELNAPDIHFSHTVHRTSTVL